jgi:transposase-like protein
MSPRPLCTQASAKQCPICRVSMLGSRTGPAPREFDHFECLNCGLVMDYSRSGNAPLWTDKSTNKIRTIIR